MFIQKEGCVITLVLYVVSIIVVWKLFGEVAGGVFLAFLYIFSMLYFTSSETSKIKRILKVLSGIFIFAFFIAGIPFVLEHYFGYKIVEAYLAISGFVMLIIFIWAAIVTYKER